MVGKGRYVGPAVKAVAGALVLLPVALGFLFVRRFGVDVPFGDVWTMVERFDKLSSGALTFRDMWIPHWEHRILFPRAVLLLVGVLADFDQVVIMYMIQLLLLATLVTLLLAFVEDVGWRPLLFVPVPFLLFGLGQHFNLFNGMQIAFTLALFFGVLALYMLHRATRRGFGTWAFAAALAGGTVASFSLLSGLFVWPVGFLQLLVSPLLRRTKLLSLAAWSLGGLLVWAAYFYGWKIPERQESFYFFYSPSLGVDFFLMALGNPLAWWAPPTFALVCGLLLAAVTLLALFLVFRTGRVDRYSFWLAVLAYSALYLVFLTLGRSGGGATFAMTSRYVTFTVLGIAGVYVMLARLTVEDGSWVVRGALGLVFALVLATAPFSYAAGFEMGERLNTIKEREAALISTYASRPDSALNITNRRADYVRQNSYVLCRLEYGVFSEPGVRARNCLPPPFEELASAGPGGRYAVGAVAGVRVGRREEPVVVPANREAFKVTGWAVDAPNKEPAGGVYIRVDDELFPAFYGRQRPEPKKPGRKLRHPFSGFEATIPTPEIGPGRHELSVVVVTENRERYYEPREAVEIEVKERASGRDRADR